jgi:GH15 family glucan-1,4-alpha-glucosidase
VRPHEPGLLIEDHAVIGDTQTMALVAIDGSITWLCLPRFDSAACFASLLGDESNGRWQICPRGLAEGVVLKTTRRYREGTMVLETEWETATGVVRLIDAMPPRDGHADVVRRVEGVSGEVEMAMRFTVRFGYGKDIPWVRRTEDGLLAVAGPDALILRGDASPEPTHGETSAHHAYFTVRAGESKSFSLCWYPSNEPVPHLHDVGESIERTERFWREWSARSTYQGEYAEAVERSLLTLKALTYAPTGGIAAAPTTSLPEAIGGPRNWDYRYCWLRDATLVLLAMVPAGYHDEARAWTNWLLRAVAGSPAQLQIVYGLAGERSLPEMDLPWLPGYEGSLPVRVGNAASEQFQLDIYGELMSALHMARGAKVLADDDDEAWDLQRAILTQLVDVMDDPDSGLWEVRSGERHYTHSRVMVWVAFDRAVRDVEAHGLDGDVELWRRLRDQIHAEVCEKGWSEQQQSFVQHYGGEALDASLLVMSSVGFLPGDDPRILGTIEAVERGLRHGRLVDRYIPAEAPDGLPGGEGSFLACSFWLVTALAHAGRWEEATRLFEELLALRNDVGLLAEEHDGTRMLGNFPQAFSHLALVEAAQALHSAHPARINRPSLGHADSQTPTDDARSNP